MKKILLGLLIIINIMIGSSNAQSIKKYEVTSIEEFKQVFIEKTKKFEEMYQIIYVGDDEKVFSKRVNEEAKKAVRSNPDTNGRMIYRTMRIETAKGISKMSIHMSYSSTKEQQEEAEKRAKKVAEKIEETFSKDYYKVKMVNYYIAKETVYDLKAKHAYSAYGTLIEKRAVCQGYAYAAYLILKNMGIETLYVNGYAGEEKTPHAWNMVKIDNEWYHMDITFNDPLPDRGNHASSQYLLISDKEIAKDHEWERERYPKAKQSYQERWAWEK